MCCSHTCLSSCANQKWQNKSMSQLHALYAPCASTVLTTQPSTPMPFTTRAILRTLLLLVGMALCMGVICFVTLKLRRHMVCLRVSRYRAGSARTSLAVRWRDTRGSRTGSGSGTGSGEMGSNASGVDGDGRVTFAYGKRFRPSYSPVTHYKSSPSQRAVLIVHL